MSSLLIGVSGKKRSGKDTFFGVLKDTLPNHKIKRYSFADGVRAFAYTYFNIPESYWEVPKYKEKKRFILKGIGQMMRDECDKEFWVNQVIDKYYRDRREDDNIIGVVTDVRYPNEARTIENMGILLRINRPKLEINIHDKHPSEVSLDDYSFEHVIYNDADLSTYEGRIKEWIQKELL